MPNWIIRYRLTKTSKIAKVEAKSPHQPTKAQARQFIPYQDFNPIIVSIQRAH
jgi:hypothetical protein